MSSIRSLAQHLHHLLTEVAEDLARQSGAVRRVRCFSGASLIQTLVFGWLVNPQATLEELTRLAALRGVSVSAQALNQRFTATLADCLEQLLQQVIQLVVTSDPVAIPLLERFAGVFVLDSTTISLPAALAARFPGCGGQAGQGQTALKLQVRLDLCHGTLAGPDLDAGRASDRSSRLQHTPLPPGSLRIADLGYLALAVLREIGAAGGYWLTRWRANTVIADPDGTRWADIAQELAHRAGSNPLDLPVRLGVAEQLPARLLAIRVPQAVADRRRRQQKRRAQRNGYTARKASLAMADWTILVTNVPADRLTLDEALVLLRARWQIEVLFKRWKSLGGLTQWRSVNPERIRAELAAKLIGLVLQHWLLVIGCWSVPARSLTKASQVVRGGLLLVVQAFDHRPAVIAALTTLTQRMTVGCRLNRRRAHPNSYQLLLDPALGG